jgi:hypothetical protein
MNTKKLILGFCSLVAVTGGSPQVFGDKRPSPHDILAARIPVERRGQYEADLNAIEKRLKDETANFKKMGDEEIKCAKLMALYEQRADIICEFVFHSVYLLDVKIASLRKELGIAYNAAKHVFFFDRNCAQIKEKAENLQAALQAALQEKKLVPERFAANWCAANGYRREAAKLKDKVFGLCKQRCVYFKNVISEEIRRRKCGLEADVAKLKGTYLSSLDLEPIVGRIVQDVAVLHAVADRCDDDVRVIMGVANACKWQNDHDWFSWVCGDDDEWYRTCEVSHVRRDPHPKRGLYRQIDRCRIFRAAYERLKDRY